MTPITKADIKTYIQFHQAEIEEAWKYFVRMSEWDAEFLKTTDKNSAYLLWRFGFVFHALQSIPGEVEGMSREEYDEFWKTMREVRHEELDKKKIAP